MFTDLDSPPSSPLLNCATKHGSVISTGPLLFSLTHSPSPLSCFPSATIFNFSLHSQFLPLSLKSCLLFIRISLKNQFKPRVVLKQLLLSLTLCLQKRFRLNRLNLVVNSLDLPLHISDLIAGYLFAPRLYWISSCLGVPCVFALRLPPLHLSSSPFSIAPCKHQLQIHIASLAAATTLPTLRLAPSEPPVKCILVVPSSDLIIAQCCARLPFILLLS